MMTTTLTANIIADIVATYTNVADMGTVRYPAYLKTTVPFANGTGNLQANVMWADRRVLSANASDTLAFAGGTLLDAFGGAVELDYVKAVYVKSSDQNTVDIRVGSDFGLCVDSADRMVVKPGGLILLVAPGALGYAVSATTSPDAQTITVIAGSAAVTYDIFVVGVEVA